MSRDAASDASRVQPAENRFSAEEEGDAYANFTTQGGKNFQSSQETNGKYEKIDSVQQDMSTKFSGY